MRDSYDQTDTGFAEWQATGDIGAYEWGDHLDVVRAAVARGVRIRRVRLVSEPLSDYLRWEHACTDVNLKAGEDVRWLPRTNEPERPCCVPRYRLPAHHRADVHLLQRDDTVSIRGIT